MTLNFISFEPTYEELKFVAFFNFLHMLYWFEPTYEELKWNKRWIKMSEKNCLSLPMRNWNMVRFNITINSYISLSLPMRNWNGYFFPLGTFWQEKFEPTYEELKCVILWRNCYYNLCLSLPMRNWNKLFLFRLFL